MGPSFRLCGLPRVSPLRSCPDGSPWPGFTLLEGCGAGEEGDGCRLRRLPWVPSLKGADVPLGPGSEPPGLRQREGPTFLQLLRPVAAGLLEPSSTVALVCRLPQGSCDPLSGWRLGAGGAEGAGKRLLEGYAGPYAFFPNNTWCFIFDFQRHSLALSGQVRRCCTASCFHFANVPPPDPPPAAADTQLGSPRGCRRLQTCDARARESLPAGRLCPVRGAVGAPPEKASGPCGPLRLPALRVSSGPNSLSSGASSSFC